MLRTRLAPLLVLALASACTEDASFTVRWKLHAHTDEVFSDLAIEALPPLDSVDECTGLGISRIQMTTRRCGEVCDADAAIVDERSFPCFPSDFAEPEVRAPGPEVGPGRYTVTLTAYSRRGIPFCAIPDDAETGGGETGDASTGETAGDPLAESECEIVASSFREVTIAETGEGKKVPDFLIIGVPECSDGIDNDLDGYTDLSDPSCRGDRGAAEQGDLATAQITVRPSLMSGNPHATCGGLGLRHIQLELAGPTAVEQRFDCTTTSQTETWDLVPGDYTLKITGIGFDGALRATIDLGDQASFNLAPSGFRSLDVPADFTIPTFDAPLEAGFSFSLEYQAEPGALPLTDCSPKEGQLVLDQVRVTVLDQDMNPVPSAALSDLGGPILLDGATIPCTEMLKIRTVEPLTWDDAPGDYTALHVAIEAFPMGSATACYGNTTDPAPAAPNASFPILVPRLSNEGDCAD